MKRIINAFSVIVVIFCGAMMYRSLLVADTSRVLINYRDTVAQECFFEENSAELSAKAKECVDTQFKWLKEHPQFSVVVHGYAAEAENEEDTSAKYALWLSERRANTVREYLMSKGIEGFRISFASHGQSEDETEERDRAKKRRTVTELKSTK